MSDYLKKLEQTHLELGVSKDVLMYAKKIYMEANSSFLICGGKDKFNRDFYLIESALAAWQSMQNAAQKEDIFLEVVSAYRSVEYQANIIKNKLVKGLKVSNILKVSAAPGLSEHHTGCAIDISSPDETEVLTEGFEKTEAYQWLRKNAAKHDFTLSYPRNNGLGFGYEPWHWCYKSK